MKIRAKGGSGTTGFEYGELYFAIVVLALGLNINHTLNVGQANQSSPEIAVWRYTCNMIANRQSNHLQLWGRLDLPQFVQHRVDIKTVKGAREIDALESQKD